MSSFIQMNKSPNSCDQRRRREEEIHNPIVANQHRDEDEEIYSSISTIVPNQQREEEEEIKIPNSAGDLDYGTMLPREIWFCIGKRLESRLDVSRFRSVCRTWRSVLPPPFRFPMRVPPSPSFKLDKKVSDHYFPPGVQIVSGHFITEVTFYDLNGRIVVFEEDRRGGGFSASSIVPRRQASLPEFLELPPIDQISNLYFLAKAYHLHDAIPRSPDATECDFDANIGVLKIAIISSDGSANINPNYPRLGDLKVVAQLAADRKLAVLRLGGGAMNNSWETGFCSIAFDDIVNYRGRLYAVESSGRAFVMDYESLNMVQIAPALTTYDFTPLSYWRSTKWKLMHLAVVSGDLYMFVQEYKDIQIVVPPGIPKLYKLSLRLGRWVEADQDLPGQEFIANMMCNFPVSKDLLRGHEDEESRFCSTNHYEFVRAAVGFKAKSSWWNFRQRKCDRECLPFYRP